MVGHLEPEATDVNLNEKAIGIAALALIMLGAASLIYWTARVALWLASS